MTKIMMLGTTAALAIAMATPSFAQSRRDAREAYAQEYGFNSGCTSHCGPARALGFWQPGMCWVDQDKLRRLGYYAPCKK